MEKTNRRQEWVRNSSTKTLETVLNTSLSPEKQADTVNFPLASKAHIEGIGWIELSAIRDEVARRKLGEYVITKETGDPRLLVGWSVTRPDGTTLGIFDTQADAKFFAAEDAGVTESAA